MIKLSNMTNPTLKNHAVRIIQEKCKIYTGNQLLHFIIDIPSGINDLFKMSKIFFKEGKHAILVGNAGSSKAELMQLVAILNEICLLELDVPSFGEPIKF